MNSPIEGLQQAAPRPKFDPYTGKPIEEPEPGRTFWAEQQNAAQHVADTLPPSQPTEVNPFAPTGWGKKNRVETDVQLPSGQLCRVMRLEREDLFRLNLMGYLDTFSPMLMEDTISAEERNKRIKDKMSNDSNAIANMFMAIDEVVMAAAVKPKVTNDQKLADYGGPSDWTNPSFIPTAYINDISMEDRFAVFATSFGRSMDDLKSLWGETPGLAGVADESGVQQASE